ncbi:carboxypeptidase-like regulatory domain-containing protein [Carboxylicivirga linearis]|uniref:Carboxypeptidase-like regulatory domain-containing protein n=1 Tax=Carboxylicivirga linearis TaxID=1628157 RepID=A0ABS5JQN2_9BACT|nr:carboxypeptidase-like regulatory domain-containing protein [Carboxylicivirga linearis]MBS2097180.1 carboxypeptidase-like regulatory domain-containing protein [Carboxylicivirga linearis]
MKYLTLIIALLINISVLEAQQRIKGKIINSYDHPIPYATISVTGTNKGCYSNTDGCFELISNKDSLAVSCIGYISEQIKIDDYNDTLYVVLQKNDIALKEVVVTSQKTKLKKVKDQGKIACSVCASKGMEIISFIPVPKGSTLNNLTFYCKRTRTKRIAGLRLYTYNYKNEPEEILMTENLVVDIAPYSNKILFDVKKLNIVVPQNGLYAGLVFMDANTAEMKKKDKTNPYVYLSSKHLTKQTYIRKYNDSFKPENFPCSVNKERISNLQCSYSYY